VIHPAGTNGKAETAAPGRHEPRFCRHFVWFLSLGIRAIRPQLGPAIPRIGHALSLPTESTFLTRSRARAHTPDAYMRIARAGRVTWGACLGYRNEEILEPGAGARSSSAAFFECAPKESNSRRSRKRQC
jgi:hypothetical protein